MRRKAAFKIVFIYAVFMLLFCVFSESGSVYAAGLETADTWDNYGDKKVSEGKGDGALPLRAGLCKAGDNGCVEVTGKIVTDSHGIAQEEIRTESAGDRHSDFVIMSFNVVLHFTEGILVKPFIAGFHTDRNVAFPPCNAGSDFVNIGLLARVKGIPFHGEGRTTGRSGIDGRKVVIHGMFKAVRNDIAMLSGKPDRSGAVSACNGG